MANSSEDSGMKGSDHPASSSETRSDSSHVQDNKHPFNTSASEVNSSNASEAEHVTDFDAVRSDESEGNEESIEDRVTKEILLYEQRFRKMKFPHLGSFNFEAERALINKMFNVEECSSKTLNTISVPQDLNIDWRTATSAELATLISQKNRRIIDNCDLPRPQNFVLESNSDGIPSWRQPTLSVEQDPEINWMTATTNEIVAFISKKSREIIGNCDLPPPQNFDDAPCSMPPRVSALQNLEIDWRTATFAELAFLISQKNRQVIDNCDLPRPSVPQNNLDGAPPLWLSMQQPTQAPHVAVSSLEDKMGQHAVQSIFNAGASLKPEDNALKVRSSLERMLFRQTYIVHTQRNLIRIHEMERECHKLLQETMPDACNP